MAINSIARLVCVATFGFGGFVCQPPCSASDRASEAELLYLLSRSDLVFTGRLVEVGACAPGYSGIAATFQMARYEKIRVLKGNFQGDAIVVGHPIVLNDPHVSRNAPCLREEVFKPGERLLVFAKRVKYPRRRKYDAEALSRRTGVITPITDEVQRITLIMETCALENSFATRGGLQVSVLDTETNEPEIGIENQHGDRRVIDREFLRYFMGDGGYDIVSTLPSPDGKHVAVELFDLDVRTRVIVVDVRGGCPAVRLDTEGAEMEGEQFSAPPNFPKRPLWISSVEIAFLVGWGESVEPELYVENLKTSDRRVRRLEEAPVSLECSDGAVVYKTAQDRTVPTGEACRR